MQAAQALANAGLTRGGVSMNLVAKYAGQPLQMTTTNQLPYGNLSYNPPNQVALQGLPRQNALSGTGSLVGLELGPPQSTVSIVVPYHSMGTVMQLGSINGVEDWSHNRDNRGQVDDYFSEEDIRTRSLEMLENEDMQHLLCMFSIGGGGVGVADDAFQYAVAFTPAVNYGLNED
ncbi:hypothetical protein SUGI_0346340 [Cryptomeria japonica]|nr:hypothetical protein SUGI_0346340 [Cryptomeria japonica]